MLCSNQNESIMGKSGSGKTTLLNILAALDHPTAGEVFLNGKALSDVRERNTGGLCRCVRSGVRPDGPDLRTDRRRRNAISHLMHLRF